MESVEVKSKSGVGKRPVLGIAGFFGHGNYGDELFLSVFEEYFGKDFDLKVIPDLPLKPYFSRPVEEMVDEVDAILTGGGDLVRPWGIDERYFNKAYLTKPIYVLGVGVPIRVGSPEEAEKPHIARRYWRYFNEPNMKFVGARDPESAKWINKHIMPRVPAVHAPDLVCSLTLPPVTKVPGAAPILGIATRLRPDRDIPDNYTQVEALAAEAKKQGWKIRHIILGTGIVGERDRENADDLNVPGKELVYSESLEDLSRAIGECSLFASMKFHGTVVATMYGVPSLVMIPTSKNRNFMKRLGRTDLVSKFDSPELVKKFLDGVPPHDPAAIARLRTESAALIEEVRAKILEGVTQPAD